MNVEKVVVGPLQTNCYILSKNNKCIIIDPGEDADSIKKKIGNREVLAILVTHFHFDHIGALEELLKFYNIKVNDYKIIKDMEVINTPGHTKDSVTYYFPKENIMFCGDFLFKDTFGRIDIGGNAYDMINSINEIQKYDKNIKLYPAHGEETYLEKEVLHFEDYIAYLKNY